MYKKFGLVFLLIGAISMIAMSSHYLQDHTSGIMRSKEVSQFLWYRLSFKAHVLFGLFAITTGALQFIRDSSLSQRGKWHKRMGYFYVVSVIISSTAGFAVAPYAMGGIVSQLGFSVLAFLWLISVILALRYIITGNLDRHRKWMYLNYGLTFAAITQRTLLLVPLLTAVPFMPVYRLSAWLPWIINIIIAYYINLKTLQGGERKLG